MDIKPYLDMMIKHDASDLFFTVGTQVKIKIQGAIRSVGDQVLTEELARDAVDSIMNEQQRQLFRDELEADFAIAHEDRGRFRVNAFHQRGACGMVLRYIKNDIPTIDQLNLPPVLAELIMHKRGIILMVGATGSGKSTTLAAMLDHRNSNATGHILTIEDPVEFVHPHKKSIFNQREVGVDTLSYHRALKSALREAPDVVLIGEIRERETMEAAIEISGTGHLAVATLHANNTSQALDRVINMFPSDLHKQLFMDLAINMRSIISQRLVRTVDGKRAAAIEILVNTPHIADLILQGRVDEVKEAMAEIKEGGMQTFDTALLDLYKAGRITMEEALLNADSQANLEARINFG